MKLRGYVDHSRWHQYFDWFRIMTGSNFQNHSLKRVYGELTIFGVKFGFEISEG